MNRVVCLLTLAGFVMGGTSCTTGETKFTSGAAAGAGIAALLGGNGDSDPSTVQGESSESAGEGETGEDGLRYFGPL